VYCIISAFPPHLLYLLVFTCERKSLGIAFARETVDLLRAVAVVRPSTVSTFFRYITPLIKLAEIARDKAKVIQIAGRDNALLMINSFDKAAAIVKRRRLFV